MNCVIQDSVVAPPGITGIGKINFQGIAPDLNATCSKSSAIDTDFFKRQDSFIPENGATRPATVTKNLKIRFIICEKNNQDSNKVNFRPSDIDALYDIVENLNQMFGHLKDPTRPVSWICGNCHIKDERIRVKLDSIIFLNKNIHRARNVIPYSDSVLNIYFGFDSNKSKIKRDTLLYSCGGEAYNCFNLFKGPFYNVREGIFMYNTYILCHRRPIVRPYNPYNTFGDLLWGETIRIFHEIHHTLGLGHLQKDGSIRQAQGEDPGGGCYDSDFLVDAIPNIPPSDTCWLDTADAVTNNIMNVVPGAWSYYLSPLQIGRIHRSSFIGLVSRYLYPTEAPTQHQWIVDKDQTWDFPIRMYQDIRVKSGHTLTIKCKVQMPSHSRIIVEHGAKLIVDGGLITSYNQGRTWGGIKASGNLNKPSDPQYQGVVVLENGAVIARAQTGVSNYLSNNPRAIRLGAGGGGIIRASHSSFYNCERAVELVNYDRYTYPYGNCSFTNCNFLWDDTTIHIYHSGAFTSWNTKGRVIIKGCKFKDETAADSVTSLLSRHATAIHLEATQALISTDTFFNFFQGVSHEGYGAFATRQLVVTQNYFDNFVHGVTYAGTCFGDIRRNTFTHINSVGYHVSDYMVTTDTGYAVYLDNMAGSYVGCDNLIDGATTQNYAAFLGRYGVIVNNSNQFASFVTGNEFDGINIGIQTQYNNPNLTLFCNDHYKNDIAWVINPQHNGSNYFLMNQGTGCGHRYIRAHNTFLNDYFNDIESYLTNQWEYYAWNSHDNQYPYQSRGSVSKHNCNGIGTDPTIPCFNNFYSSCLYSMPTPTWLDSITTLYNGLDVSNAGYTLSHDWLFGQIVRGYSFLNEDESLVTFLEEEKSDRANRLLIRLYFELGNYEMIDETINALSISNDEKKAYKDYYNTLVAVKTEGRYINSLTESEYAIIESLAKDGFEVSTYAKGLLDIAYNEEWHHPIFSAPASADFYQVPNEVNPEKSQLGNAIPNPARESVRLEVSITKKDADLNPRLLIYSMSGKRVYQKDLQAGKNHLLINTQA